MGRIPKERIEVGRIVTIPNYRGQGYLKKRAYGNCQ
jgi:hypothetical protein